VGSIIALIKKLTVFLATKKQKKFFCKIHFLHKFPIEISKKNSLFRLVCCFMDKIKNALTKNKNPPKKYKNFPRILLKNTKKTPKITKRTPKMTILPLFSFLGSFCNVWGLFCIIWGGIFVFF
jgi:hypothetical protein